GVGSCSGINGRGNAGSLFANDNCNDGFDDPIFLNFQTPPPAAQHSPIDSTHGNRNWCGDIKTFKWYTDYSDSGTPFVTSKFGGNGATAINNFNISMSALSNWGGGFNTKIYLSFAYPVPISSTQNGQPVCVQNIDPQCTSGSGAGTCPA